MWTGRRASSASGRIGRSRADRRVIGLPDELGRLHDARHTVATVLLVRAVPERVVMQVMGWSSNATADRYQRVTTGVLADVAKRVGGLIWEVAKEGIEGDPQPPGGTR